MKARSATQWSDGMVQPFDPVTSLRYIPGFHLRFPLITHSFAFVYAGVGQHSARWFYETYRKRFGMESSYRQSNACRTRTSTRGALLRLFYFALSMFLRNLWITFEREVILSGGIGTQKTSEYYGFANFRGDVQKNIVKIIPILTSKKGNITL